MDQLSQCDDHRRDLAHSIRCASVRARSPIARRHPRSPAKRMSSSSSFSGSAISASVSILAAPAIAKDLGVPALMVVRGQRKRHQQRSLARRCQLRHGTRAAAAQNQVRRRKLRWHVVQIWLHAHTPCDALTHQPCRFVGLRGCHSVPASGLMQNLQVLKPLQQSLRNLRHRLIQNARALAAAEDQQPAALPEVFGWIAKNSARTGIPVTWALRKYSVVCAKFTAAALTHLPSQRLVIPGTAFGSNASVGTRSKIAASIPGPLAYPPTPTTTCGLNVAQQPHALQHSQRQIEHRPQPRRQAHILQLPRPHQLQPESGLGNQPRLQPPRRAHKPDLGAMPIAQFPRNRQRRNHMPAGSPARNQNSQLFAGLPAR